MKKKSKNSFFAIPIAERPLAKIVGMRCGACEHFTHADFKTYGRLRTVQRQHSAVGVTFGRCEALDADDAIAIHRACERFVEAKER